MIFAVELLSNRPNSLRLHFVSTSLDMFDLKKDLIPATQKSSEWKLMSPVHLHDVKSEGTGSSLTSTPVTGSSQITLAESSMLRLLLVFVYFRIHLL